MPDVCVFGCLSVWGCLISQPPSDAAKRNSFRAVKNQKIACDFLIFYRFLKFYLLPTEVGTVAI
jgi:hypothetical protein